MRNHFIKITSLILFLCIGIANFSLIPCSVTSAADITELQSQNISSCRKIYISEDKKGYDSNVNTNLSFWDPMTEISIVSNSTSVATATNQGSPIVTLENADTFQVMISFKNKTTNAFLNEYKKTPDQKTELTEVYTISHDSWGAKSGKKEQTINVNGKQLYVGEIASGALVIQTSFDGTSWEQTDYGKYANGLYTTDVLDHYHGTTQTYRPNGMDIKKGVYISINFFYEVKVVTKTIKHDWFHDFFGNPLDKEDYLNICESYMLFVVEDNAEVVTFNNLTEADRVEIIESEKSDNENEAEFQKQSEQYENHVQNLVDRITSTMYDGDMSVTGFRINVTANPYLNISIERNGKFYALPEQRKESNQIFYEITESGKYHITASSFSKKYTVTLYVDAVDPDNAYHRYFGNPVTYHGASYGNNLIDYSPVNPYGNQRIFDAYSEIPVFKGPLVLQTPTHNDPEVLPIYGLITNLSTGKTYSFGTKTTTLTEYGEYKIEFYSDFDYYNSIISKEYSPKLSGDIRCYTFRFKLVGNNSGVSVNETLLSSKNFKNLSVVSPSDYVPKFYGVTRTSANKGKIIVAFAEKEAALQYARDIVWGEIERYEMNGTTYWKIPNIDNPWGAKTESYSGWQNAKTVSVISEKMVEEHYFDLTKASSYLTLEKNVTDFEHDGVELTNLQLKDLTKSVIIWYNTEQRKKATVPAITLGNHDIIQFVSKKSTAVLATDAHGVYSLVHDGEQDYRFIKDMLELDSCTLQATDENGKTYSLNYMDGFYALLQKFNCNSGVFKITESNIYGNVTASYDIYYIKGGDQPAVLSLSADGQRIYVTSQSQSSPVVCEHLNIDGIFDFIDPYTYVRIYDNVSAKYYSISDAVGIEFTNPGNYEIAVIDRFGNHFTYQFTIR